MKPEYKALGAFGTLGLEIALCIVVGTFGGRWLDEKFGTPPILMVLGFLFGLGAAGKALLRTVKEMKEVTESEEREQGNPAPRFEPKEPGRKEGERSARDEEGPRGQA
jgi:ATP synthase protein I